MNTVKIIMGSIFLMLGLSACGGGGGGDGGGTTISEGRFIDAAGEGIAYTSGGQSGFTDANGRFTYENGQSVTFSIGDIVIGTANGKAIVTPVDLVSGAVNETNAEVINIVQFLLSIDNDSNLTNGIQVTQAIRDAAVGQTIDFSISDFDTNGGVSSVVDLLTSASTFGSRVLVSGTIARDHLIDSLFSLFAATYSGTFSGTDAGTWQVTINTAGVVSGYTYSPSTGTNSASGSISTSGSITAIGTAGTSTWFANINYSTGNVSGSWVGLGGNSGNLTGNRQ